MVKKPDDDDIDANEFLGLSADAPTPEIKLHPILTNAEVLEAQAKARSKIDKERRVAAMREVEERETHRLKVEEGLTTGIGQEDERVKFTVDLPEWAPWIAVNGEPYWHGYTYDVPRHVSRSLSEQSQRAWRADDQTEGKSIAQQLQNKRHSVINGRSGAIANAPVRFDA